MSFLAELDRYLTVRRQLGADLRTDERILRRFAVFADRGGGAQCVNTNLIMRWLESLPSASPGTRATRFRVARQFCRMVARHGPQARSPTPGIGVRSRSTCTSLYLQ
jgi:integrase/recombinase XerD